MDIRFESLGLRRGQNSAKEISEAYARASALKKPTPPGKPPRLLSAKRSRHNIGRFDLYAEKEKNEKIVRPPLPHVPSKDIVTMKVGQGLSIDSRLRDDDTWQFHTSWFRDGSTVWRWVSQVLLFNAVEKTVGYTKNDKRVGSEEKPEIRVWSCGCSSGEEAFSVRMLWLHDILPLMKDINENKMSWPFELDELQCKVLGTDRNKGIIDRANDDTTLWKSTKGIPSCLIEKFIDPVILEDRQDRSAYHMTNFPQLQKDTQLCKDSPNQQSCHEEVPISLFTSASSKTSPYDAELYRISREVRTGCSFMQEDATFESKFPDTLFAETNNEASLASNPGNIKFDIIFCRYSIFLYCETEARWRALRKIVTHLHPGTGILLLGKTDSLPQGAEQYFSLVPCEGCPGAYRLQSAAELSECSTSSPRVESVQDSHASSISAMKRFFAMHQSIEDFYNLHIKEFAHENRKVSFPKAAKSNSFRVSAASEAILRMNGKLEIGFEARAKESDEKLTAFVNAKRREIDAAESSNFSFRAIRPPSEKSDTSGLTFFERMSYCKCYTVNYKSYI